MLIDLLNAIFCVAIILTSSKSFKYLQCNCFSYIHFGGTYHMSNSLVFTCKLFFDKNRFENQLFSPCFKWHQHAKTSIVVHIYPLQVSLLLSTLVGNRIYFNLCTKCTTNAANSQFHHYWLSMSQTEIPTSRPFKPFFMH